MSLAPVLLVSVLLAPPPDAARPGVFVLGVDGMDPVILQRLVDEGRMPAFAELMREGDFQTLGTSNPPQSPVAWSNFVTGLDPGGHGIFDFVHRDPRSYHPVSSATPPPSGEEVPTLEIFGYIVPLGGDDVVNNRSGTPFWDLLADAGVEVGVYRIPGNYPPTPSDALTLSGMGTVDLRGSPGDYTWYTDQPFFDDGLKADVELVSWEDRDGDGEGETAYTSLKGPPDVLHMQPGAVPTDKDFVRAPLEIHRDPVRDLVYLRLGEQSATLLNEGEWSDWLSTDFTMGPLDLMAFGGIVRFYLKEVRPELKLYASPVNIDPRAPAQPITTPDDDVAVAIAEAMGPFYTQGMPEETNALKDGLFDDDDYEAQVALVHEDGRRMLDVALDRFGSNHCTFFYLSDIDLQCHMLWRHGDPKTPGAPPHPAYDAEAAADHADDIVGYYEQVDRTLAHVRASLPDDATLIVMSDHGFQPYTRKVHLNNWLRDEGYLVLEDGKTAGEIVRGDVDWSRTRAYALGFNGLYLNRAGREGEGIVTDAEADALLDEIAAKLAALTDPETGERAVTRVDRASAIYHGDRVDEAPDLIVGYNAGYDCSDASTLGELPEGGVFADNEDRWSGSHLMAPEHVPGVVLANRPLSGSGYDLTDVTVSLLDLFDVAPAPGMDGRSMFSPSP